MPWDYSTFLTHGNMRRSSAFWQLESLLFFFRAIFEGVSVVWTPTPNWQRARRGNERQSRAPTFFSTSIKHSTEFGTTDQLQNWFNFAFLVSSSWLFSRTFVTAHFRLESITLRIWPIWRSSRFHPLLLPFSLFSVHISTHPQVLTAHYADNIAIIRSNKMISHVVGPLEGHFSCGTREGDSKSTRPSLSPSSPRRGWELHLNSKSTTRKSRRRRRCPTPDSVEIFTWWNVSLKLIPISKHFCR